MAQSALCEKCAKLMSIRHPGHHSWGTSDLGLSSTALVASIRRVPGSHMVAIGPIHLHPGVPSSLLPIPVHHRTKPREETDKNRHYT